MPFTYVLITMEGDMDGDTFHFVNALALQVEDIQHGTRLYLVDNNRDPRALS
jgi:hypothetical protein